MVKVAVLGYGTIGAGVVKVIQTNADVITKKAGQEVVVKSILDLRDFPNDPNGDKVVHDYKEIVEDEEIQLVVECMGGLEPAHTFVKTALEQGRSVATSNKELVAKYGAELIAISKEHNCNFLFEASVGGGIPIIRPLLKCLTADVIEEISGILNGTTNYMLTKMTNEGSAFDDVLKEAQAMGYAELHPEADIEGYDPCRKIAILTSLACGQQVNFEDIHTEGITKISADDIQYAKNMNRTIKLLASSYCRNGKFYAMVCPQMLSAAHPLTGVNDVFNAVFVHGNMVGDTMFYGAGAGSLPTASAVVGDVIDNVKHLGKHMEIVWEPEKMQLGDYGEIERKFFVRVDAKATDAEIEAAFGPVEAVEAIKDTEKAFITEVISEAAYAKAAEALGCVINMVRIG